MFYNCQNETYIGICIKIVSDNTHFRYSCQNQAVCHSKFKIKLLTSGFLFLLSLSPKSGWTNGGGLTRLYCRLDRCGERGGISLWFPPLIKLTAMI